MPSHPTGWPCHPQSLRVHTKLLKDGHIDTVIGLSSNSVGDETEIDLAATHGEVVNIEEAVAAAKQKHDAFLLKLGLKPLP